MHRPGRRGEQQGRGDTGADPGLGHDTRRGGAQREPRGGVRDVLDLAAGGGDSVEDPGGDGYVGVEVHGERVAGAERSQVDVLDRAGRDLDDVEARRGEGAGLGDQPDLDDGVGLPRRHDLQPSLAGAREHSGDELVAGRSGGGRQPVGALGRQADHLLIANRGRDAPAADVHVHGEDGGARCQRVEQRHLLGAGRHRDAAASRGVDRAVGAVERDVDDRRCGFGVGQVDPAALADDRAASDEPEVGARRGAGRAQQPAHRGHPTAREQAGGHAGRRGPRAARHDRTGVRPIVRPSQDRPRRRGNQVEWCRGAVQTGQPCVPGAGRVLRSAGGCRGTGRREAEPGLGVAVDGGVGADRVGSGDGHGAGRRPGRVSGGAGLGAGPAAAPWPAVRSAATPTTSRTRITPTRAVPGRRKVRRARSLRPVTSPPPRVAPRAPPVRPGRRPRRGPAPAPSRPGAARGRPPARAARAAARATWGARPGHG